MCCMVTEHRRLDLGKNVDLADVIGGLHGGYFHGDSCGLMW